MNKQEARALALMRLATVIEALIEHGDFSAGYARRSPADQAREREAYADIARDLWRERDKLTRVIERPKPRYQNGAQVRVVAGDGRARLQRALDHQAEREAFAPLYNGALTHTAIPLDATFTIFSHEWRQHLSTYIYHLRANVEGVEDAANWARVLDAVVETDLAPAE